MIDKPRLIDADALVKVVEDRYLSACVQAAPGTRRNGKSIHYGIAIGMNFIRNTINEQPTIEAEPVRHSENVTPYSGDENIMCKECGFEGEVWEYECDECGNYVDAHGFPCKYCPNCGAKMGAKGE